ncbi:MAG: hypothetical protein K5656_09645 [Lachnospiraceae bacterium]|nr:hypothetical protein [Lachnospiraceae bacterium]
MPKNTNKTTKKTNNQIIRENSGKYGEYEIFQKLLMLDCDIHDIMNIIAPEALEKYNSFYSELVNSYAKDMDPIKPKREVYGMIPLSSKGGNEQAKEATIAALDEYRLAYEEAVSNLGKEAKGFSEYLKLAGTQLDPDLVYTDAVFNNPVYASLTFVLGTGPKLKRKKDNSIDFKETEKNLRRPDGKGYYVPFIKLCKASNELWDIEKSRQANERLGWTDKTIASYKKAYKDALKNYVDAFDELSETIKRYPNEWKKDEDLQNIPDEIVGVLGESDREITFVIEHARGQLKELENGLNPDELGLLGFVGETLNKSERELRNTNKALERQENNYAKLKEKIVIDNQTLATLEANYKARNSTSSILWLANQNKELVDWYNEYKATVKDLTLVFPTEESQAKLNAYIEENKEKLAEYHELIDGYTGRKVVEELKKTIANERKRLENQEKEIEETKNTITKLEAFNKKAKAAKKTIYGKKVSNLSDKKDLLNEVDKYIALIKEYNCKDAVNVLSDNKNIIDDVRSKISLGISEDISLNAFAKDIVKYSIDIFGPNPKYHEEVLGIKKGSTKAVMPKEEFDEYIKAYDASKYPFTDLELTYLAMAGTMKAKNEIAKVYSDSKGVSIDEIISTDTSFWTSDIAINTSGHSDSMRKFKEVIKAGRENCVKAVNLYQKGDMSSVAELIHNSLKTNLTDFNQSSSFSVNAINYYSVFSTMQKLLYNNPELMEAFKNYEGKLPKASRIDLDEITVAKKICQMSIDSSNRALEFSDYIPDYNREIGHVNSNIESEKSKLIPEEEPDGIHNSIHTEFIKSLNNEKSMHNAKYNMLKFATLKGKSLKVIADSIDKYKQADVAYMEENARINNRYLANPSLENANRLNSDIKLLNIKHANMSLVYRYLITAEGDKELGDFSEKLSDKYGLADAELSSNAVGYKTSDEFYFEVEKFTLECENKAIINLLNNKKCSKKEMKELTAKYMSNVHQIDALDNAIDIGYLPSFYNKDSRNAELSKDDNKEYMSYVNDYVDTLGIDKMKPGELAEYLTINKTELGMVSSAFRISIESKKFADRYSYDFGDLSKAVSTLESGNKYVIGGTKEYTDIIDELKKFDAFRENEIREYHVSGSYNAGKLIKQEKKLIEQIDKYIIRKETEKEKGDTSRNSSKRLAAAKAAKEALKKMINVEIAGPNFNSESLNAAQIVINDLNNSMVHLPFANEDGELEVTGRQMAEKQIIKANKIAVKNASVLDKEAMKMPKKPKEFTVICTAVRDMLFFDALTNYASPARHEDPVFTKTKDNQVKEIMSSLLSKNKAADSKKSPESLNGLIKSRFGKKLINTIMVEIIDKKQDPSVVLSHKNVMKLRDEKLRECYKEATSTLRSTFTKTMNVEELFNIAENLGSKELSSEHLRYKAAQANKAKAATNTAKNQEAKNEGIKL